MSTRPVLPVFAVYSAPGCTLFVCCLSLRLVWTLEAFVPLDPLCFCRHRTTFTLSACARPSGASAACTIGCLLGAFFLGRCRHKIFEEELQPFDGIRRKYVNLTSNLLKFSRVRPVQLPNHVQKNSGGRGGEKKKNLKVLYPACQPISLPGDVPCVHHCDWVAEVSTGYTSWPSRRAKVSLSQSSKSLPSLSSPFFSFLGWFWLRTEMSSTAGRLKPQNSGAPTGKSSAVSEEIRITSLFPFFAGLFSLFKFPKTHPGVRLTLAFLALLFIFCYVSKKKIGMFFIFYDTLLFLNIPDNVQKMLVP